MSEDPNKNWGRLIPMRVWLDGASVERLRGIRAVLEAEIGVLQQELEDIKKRISDKEAAGYPEQP